MKGRMDWKQTIRAKKWRLEREEIPDQSMTSVTKRRHQTLQELIALKVETDPHMRSSAERLFIGCVTRGRSRGEFAQPRKRLLDNLCTVTVQPTVAKLRGTA